MIDEVLHHSCCNSSTRGAASVKQDLLEVGGIMDNRQATISTRPLLLSDSRSPFGKEASDRCRRVEQAVLCAPVQVGDLLPKPGLDINRRPQHSTTIALVSVEESLEHIQAGQRHCFHDSRTSMMFGRNKEEFNNSS